MKIVLVNPYCPDSDHIQPPLGLGYLATSLRKQSIEVLLLDANKEKLKTTDLIKFINKEKPDFVGFQLYSLNVPQVKEALLAIKKTNTKIKTIVGGPHPSALPHEIFNLMGESLDYAFTGEAEIGLPLLLNSKINNFNKIPGLIYRKNNRVHVNRHYFNQNLDDFGEPSWDLIKPETYPEAQHGAFFKQFPIAPIITTRGCPFNCTFCAGKLISGKKFRTRSPKRVIAEIKYLYHERGIREFHIVDDNFTLDRQHALEIIKGILSLKFKATFAVPNGVRLDTLDKDMLYLMKKTGFYLISVGIESGSDRILKLMRKNLLTSQIKEKIDLINNSGLKVAGFFVLGYPGETEKEINRTIEFSLSLGLLRANYFLFLPLPGTQIFQELSANNQVDYNEIINSSFTNAKSYCQVSTRKLKSLQKSAFIKFYARPDILINNLITVKRPKQLFYLAKRAIHWLS